ncbi:MAG: RNA polymerase sigma factor [Faecousia sp.]
MKNQYPEKRDPVPKRRKAQDNPYELFTVGIHTEHPHFFVQFVDSTGEMRCVEVSRSIYATLDRFELDDLSFLNEVDNHYEHSDLTESSLHQRAARNQESVEDTVMKHIQSENLHKAIATLPELQRRRLVLYFFGDYTYEQIGEMEGCTKVAVKHSVDKAIMALGKKIEK